MSFIFTNACAKCEGEYELYSMGLCSKCHSEWYLEYCPKYINGELTIPKKFLDENPEWKEKLEYLIRKAIISR